MKKYNIISVLLLTMFAAMVFSSGLVAQNDYPEGWVSISNSFQWDYTSHVYHTEFDVNSEEITEINTIENYGDFNCTTSAYNEDGSLAFFTLNHRVFNPLGEQVGSLFLDQFGSYGIDGNSIVFKTDGIFWVLYNAHGSGFPPVPKNIMIYATAIEVLENGDINILGFFPLSIDIPGADSFLNPVFIKDYEEDKVDVYFVRSDENNANILCKRTFDGLLTSTEVIVYDKAQIPGHLEVIQQPNNKLAFASLDKTNNTFSLLEENENGGFNKTAKTLPIGIALADDFEFKSRDEVNMFYFSRFATDGILEYDIETNSITQTIGVAMEAHSEIERAPNGNFYFYRDYETLGKIDGKTGEYLGELLFPFEQYSINSLILDDVYVLPDNCNIIPWITEYQITGEDCNAEDGIIQMQLHEALFPVHYILTNSEGTVIEGDQEYASNSILTIEGLGEEVYSLEITDVTGMSGTYEAIYVPNLAGFTYENGYDVNTNTTWTGESWTFGDDLIIESGVTLTLNNCTFEFDEGAGVIIRPDAHLVIENNSTLTNFTCHSDKMWAGIDIQATQNNRGELIIMNSNIQYADQAIDLLPFNYSVAGEAAVLDAFLYNNEVDVIAMSIPQINTSAGFVRTVFAKDQNYLGGLNLTENVHLSGITGLRFRACQFFNNNPNLTQARAINTNNNAGCYISNEEGEISKFKDYWWAVYSTESRVSIENTIFEGNEIGIRLNRVNNAYIYDNDFYIGEIKAGSPSSSQCGAVKGASYGISMNNSSGFAIEENRFYKEDGAASGNYTGIFLTQTQAQDEIYKNTFDGVSFANYSTGINWVTGNIYEGLAYFCNQQENNQTDIDIQEDTNGLGGVQSISGGEDLSSGNTFSQWATTKYHIRNNGNHPLIYYHDDEGIETPTKLSGYVFPIEINNSNECPSHYGGGGGGTGTRSLVLSEAQKTETENTYYAHLSDYENTKYLFEQLKDGGNTDAMVNQVEDAWPQDMWLLRSRLLGTSPHLSLEVLKKAADKTDVLPDAVIFEVLAANPDELKKEELIKYLEDKENPLPEYMINILKQVATGISYKTILLNQMAYHSQKKTRAANDMIRSIINEDVIDYTELRNWLDNRGGKRADEQIIDTYLQEGDYNSAIMLADMLPELYNYSEEQINEHNLYMDILNLKISLAQNNRSIYELDTDEIATLENIANSSLLTAGASARGILESAYGYSFCDCLNVEDTTYFKGSAKPPIEEDLIELIDVELRVYPNPATIWTAFEYVLNDKDSQGLIEIRDVQAKIVDRLTVNGQQGQKIWNTSKVTSGTYTYTFTVDGVTVKSGKIIVQ